MTKWNRCQQIRVWLNFQETKSDPEDSWYWEFRCAPCIAERDGLDLKDAQMVCHKSRFGWEKTKERIDTFRNAKAHTVELFPQFTGKMVRNVARATLVRIFEPLAKYILRKLAVMNKRQQLFERHSELMIEFESASSMDRSEALLVELETLAEGIEDTERPLAFRDRARKDLKEGATVEEVDKRQWEYFMTATFTDLWARIYDSRGNTIGAFMSFYVCLGNLGGGQVCCLIVPNPAFCVLRFGFYVLYFAFLRFVFCVLGFCSLRFGVLRFAFCMLDR